MCTAGRRQRFRVIASPKPDTQSHGIPVWCHWCHWCHWCTRRRQSTTWPRLCAAVKQIKLLGRRAVEFFSLPLALARSLARSLPSWRHSPVACVSWDVDLQSRVHARASPRPSKASKASKGTSEFLEVRAPVSGIVPDGEPSAHPPLMSVHTTRMASHRRHHPRCCRRSCQSTQSPPRTKRPRPSHGR